jgi:ADP-heptose:LPS heptosyltransferase
MGRTRANCVRRCALVPAERVLVVRMDGIGDALALAPLIAALSDAGHELGAVLSVGNREAFAPGVFARVHVLERIPWPRHGSTADSYARVLRETVSSRYSVALIASEEPEAYRLAREAGIGRRIGFTNGWEKPLKGFWSRSQLTTALHRTASAGRVKRHEVETLFALGAGLHAEPAPTKDARRLAPLVVRDAPAHGRVLLQVGAKHADRGLGADAFVALARSIAARYPFVAVASAAEAAFARPVAENAGVPLELPPSLDAWKKIVAGARAVVTLDSGAAHVAGMVDVPCVDIFADGPHVAADMRRWSPWAARARLIVAGRTASTLPEEAARALDDVLSAGLER